MPPGRGAPLELLVILFYASWIFLTGYSLVCSEKFLVKKARLTLSYLIVAVHKIGRVSLSGNIDILFSSPIPFFNKVNAVDLSHFCQKVACNVRVGLKKVAFLREDRRTMNPEYEYRRIRIERSQKIEFLFSGRFAYTWFVINVSLSHELSKILYRANRLSLGAHRDQQDRQTLRPVFTVSSHISTVKDHHERFGSFSAGWTIYIYIHTHRAEETWAEVRVETDTWRDISTVCIIPYQERRSLVSTPVDDSNPLRRTKRGGLRAKRKRFSRRPRFEVAVKRTERERKAEDYAGIIGRPSKVVTSRRWRRLFCRPGTGSAVPNSMPPDLSASRITSTH